MPEIPEEAVKAAAEAIRYRTLGRFDDPPDQALIVARDAVEAAAPVLAAQVRRETAEQIASAIEARRCPMDRKFCDDCVCRPEDAALARQMGEARDSG